MTTDTFLPLRILFTILVSLVLITAPAQAEKPETEIEHPIAGGLAGIPAVPCPNCGMMTNHFARTRYTFSFQGGRYTTCSIHCLADMIKKSESDADQIEVALYLHPETMIGTDSAVYVIGSRARGTMTMKSKLAFATTRKAKEFQRTYGGKLADFSHALALATRELEKSYAKIEAKRKKKGKIKDPGPTARCMVCNMYPARYPGYRTQLVLKNGTRYHFCSTHCLLNFLKDPRQYHIDPSAVRTIWVTLTPSGSWEYAPGVYYLIESDLSGPMGAEAIAYRFLNDAKEAARQHGGQVVDWQTLLKLRKKQ